MAAIELILIILAFGVASSRGRHAFMLIIVPTTFTSMIRRLVSSGVSLNDPNAATPALFTSKSNFPPDFSANAPMAEIQPC